MDTAELGKTVRVNAGTTVHVWDFEACASDEWLIDGHTAEHEFRVKEEFTSPTREDAGPHLVLVQPGFDHEYEIRVRARDVTAIEVEEAPEIDLTRTLTSLASVSGLVKRFQRRRTAP